MLRRERDPDTGRLLLGLAVGVELRGLARSAGSRIIRHRRRGLA
jgi:hypothetical protein